MWGGYFSDDSDAPCWTAPSLCDFSLASRKAGTGVRKYSLLTPTKGMSGEFCGNQEPVCPVSYEAVALAVLGKV